MTLPIIIRMDSGAETRRGHSLRSHSASGVRRICKSRGAHGARNRFSLTSAAIKFRQEPFGRCSETFHSIPSFHGFDDRNLAKDWKHGVQKNKATGAQSYE